MTSIFDHVDIDGNGIIDYSEWVVGTINKQKLLTKPKLKQIFQLFDKDNSGQISASEIKEVLIPN